MFLNRDMIDKFRDGVWCVDCVRMSLTKGGVIQYEGPGFMRQNFDGMIQYTVYPSQPISNTLQALTPTAPHAAGTLLGPNDFSTLEGLDSVGTLWRIDQTLPRPTTCFVGGGVHRIVNGDAHEIRFSRTFVQEVSSLTLVYYTEVEIPGNARTETTTVIAGGNPQETSRLDVAKFSTSFGNFLIYSRSGMIVVDVSEIKTLPPQFESRVTEALALVIARPFVWNVAMTHDGGMETVRIRPRKEPMAANLPPPVFRGTVDLSGGDVWRLFDKYLTLLCTHTADDFHPCSRHLYSVLEASAGAISSRALALGVAVEGIAKDMFPHVGVPPADLKPIVSRLRNYIREWDEYKTQTTKDLLYTRVDSMLGRILEASAASRLYALAKVKVVVDSNIIAWKELRHAAAHGVTPDLNNLQRLVDLCDAVTVLMYHLVFRAAGYEGSYRDYSTHGFPKRYYRGRSVTEEEKSVAAYYLAEKKMHQDDVARWYAGKSDLEHGLY